MNLEITLGAYILWGEEGSEFRGPYTIKIPNPLLPTTTYDLNADLIQQMIYIRLKASF